MNPEQPIPQEPAAPILGPDGAPAADSMFAPATEPADYIAEVRTIRNRAGLVVFLREAVTSLDDVEPQLPTDVAEFFGVGNLPITDQNGTLIQMHQFEFDLPAETIEQAFSIYEETLIAALQVERERMRKVLTGKIIAHNARSITKG